PPPPPPPVGGGRLGRAPACPPPWGAPPPPSGRLTVRTNAPAPIRGLCFIPYLKVFFWGE
ncbi:hypothetical protein C2L94_01760, partial [Coxiella burnetii]